jgi:hypothetical protein
MYKVFIILTVLFWAACNDPYAPQNSRLTYSYTVETQDTFEFYYFSNPYKGHTVYATYIGKNTRHVYDEDMPTNHSTFDKNVKRIHIVVDSFNIYLSKRMLRYNDYSTRLDTIKVSTFLKQY